MGVKIYTVNSRPEGYEAFKMKRALICNSELAVLYSSSLLSSYSALSRYSMSLHGCSPKHLSSTLTHAFTPATSVHGFSPTPSPRGSCRCANVVPQLDQRPSTLPPTKEISSKFPIRSTFERSCGLDNSLLADRSFEGRRWLSSPLRSLSAGREGGNGGETV